MTSAGIPMYPYGTPRVSPHVSPRVLPPETAQAAAGDTEFPDGIYVVRKDYLTSFPENAYRILTGPLRYDRDDWINVAIVVNVTGGLLLLDETLIDFWQDDVKGDFTETLADGFRPLGESEYIIAGSFGAYALAEMLGLKREKATALSAFQSFALTAGLISGVKYVTGRERPENTGDRFDFDGPAEGDFNASFPSGHAGHAFAVASVISEMYKEDNPWVPWVTYPLATGTVLARVDDNRHWFSDVFLVGAFGYFIGKMVVRYSPFLERNNITLLPMTRGGLRGVSLSYRY
ncbi:MAG: phosphatase PAP2 family protein [Alphaproteobacteria bacterium]